MSDDLIVNNVGLSSAYQSPHHRDANDMGPTVAFAVKCPVAATRCASECSGGAQGARDISISTISSEPRGRTDAWHLPATTDPPTYN